MDYIIITLLVILFLYLVIRDVIIAKKRRKNHVMLKRVSTKLDQLNKESTKQNKLFEKLLDILSED